MRLSATGTTCDLVTSLTWGVTSCTVTSLPQGVLSVLGGGGGGGGRVTTETSVYSE